MGFLNAGHLSPQFSLVAQTIKCLPAKQEISLSSVRGKKREFNLPPHLSVDQGLTQTTPHPPPPERRNARLEDATSTWRIRTLPGPVRTLALEAPPPPPPTAFHIPTHFYTCSKFRHTLIHMHSRARAPHTLTNTHLFTHAHMHVRTPVILHLSAVPSVL